MPAERLGVRRKRRRDGETPDTPRSGLIAGRRRGITGWMPSTTSMCVPNSEEKAARRSESGTKGANDGEAMLLMQARVFDVPRGVCAKALGKCLVQKVFPVGPPPLSVAFLLMSHCFSRQAATAPALPRAHTCLLYKLVLGERAPRKLRENGQLEVAERMDTRADVVSCRIAP